MITVKENDFGALHVSHHENVGLVVHVDIYEWNKKNARECYNIWLEFMEELHEQGHDTVYAAIPRFDRKNEKFAEMFGFTLTRYRIKDNESDKVYKIWQCSREEI